jgi:hypothetical protein
MSEKVYAWLLRLYPARFREAYGEEALQLFRDRARDEKGFFPRLRLWLDLVADLAISVPRQHHHVQPDLVGASAPQRLDGVPSFQVLNGDLPRPGALLVGFVLSVIAVATFSVLLSHRGNYRELRASLGPEQRAAGRPSSDFNPPASRSLRQVEEQTIAPARIGALSRVAPEGTKPSDLRSSSLPASNDSKLQQPNVQLPKSPDAAAVIYPAVVEMPKLDAATRHNVIKGAIANLNEYYVYPEVAQKMADSLLAHERSGEDNAATDGAVFASLVTRQMRDVSHDRHLLLFYSSVPVPERPPGPAPGELARYRRDMEQNNCTFERVDVLPGNIGYLKFDEFPDPSVCRSTVVTSMNRLQHMDAIIFDLRENHGGDPKMVALIAGYLFGRPTHLNDMYDRRKNSTQQYWTSSPIPGNRLADKPAYVLTSASTFSGAEEFSYDLKMLKRATLVGETTAGGAHPASQHRIDDHFRIRVPFARPINPISKTNWEGTGVEPDVKVNAADALKTAEKLAARRLQKK